MSGGITQSNAPSSNVVGAIISTATSSCMSAMLTLSAFGFSSHFILCVVVSGHISPATGAFITKAGPAITVKGPLLVSLTETSSRDLILTV